jgi:tRNA(Ile)-lysidine synthase
MKPAGSNVQIVSVLCGSGGVERDAQLVRKVERCLDRLHSGLAGVAAVSGGPDSVALLRALVALRGQRPDGRLVIAHLNHQLRGTESDTDEAFVRSLHAEFVAAGFPGLELRCHRLDVAAVAAAESANAEAVARRVRYNWLAQVAAEAGVPWVATGHTANDQAETVLHRLLRGTGLRGLRGIAAQRPLSCGVRLVRPLLDVTRTEVLAYLDAQQQPYRHDSSNLDLDYTRNRIRHELLPHLAERYNPAVVEVLGRLAEQAGEAYQHIESQALGLLAAAELPRAGPLLVFDRRRMGEAPREVLREALRLAWEREGWPLGTMTFGHWDRLARVARGEAAAVDLPGGIQARCQARVVQLGPAS